MASFYNRWAKVLSRLDALDVVTSVKQGFANYQDADSSLTPIDILPDTWVDIPNDGAGAFTNLDYLPSDTTGLLNPSTGYLDFSQLTNGDTVLIRTHYEVTPESDNANIEFRLLAGSGFGEYALPEAGSRLDEGAGKRYERVKLHKIAIFDDNTRLNPVRLQIKCSVNAVFKNFGSILTVLRA